jgi:hypothetical protein
MSSQSTPRSITLHIGLSWTNYRQRHHKHWGGLVNVGPLKSKRHPAASRWATGHRLAHPTPLTSAKIPHWPIFGAAAAYCVSSASPPACEGRRRPPPAPQASSTSSTVLRPHSPYQN